MRRSQPIKHLFASILLLSLFSALSVIVTAQVTNTTHPANSPYATIQAAINDGITVTGDVITVAAGTYAENVTLNKSLTINGAKSGVDGRGRVAGAPNPAVESVVGIAASGLPALNLQASSSGSIIDGFAFIANPGGTDGVISNLGAAVLTGITIRNNYIKPTGSTGAAIWLARSMLDLTFDKNEITGSTAGTQVIFLSTNSYNGLFITNNNIRGSGGVYGLFVDGVRNVGTSATPRSPLIQGNLFDGHQAGINGGSRSLQDAQVLENTFSNNSVTGFQGGPKNSNFARNTFSNNLQYGMSLTAFGSTDPLRGGQSTTIQNNFFSNNATAAGALGTTHFGDILLSDQTSGTQNSNTITNNSLLSTIAIYDNEPNGGTDPIHATCNWYGTSSGSAVAAKIFNVAGGIVIYSPWLTNGTDNDLVTPGFQPVGGSCNGVQTEFYVNDAFLPGDHYTTASGSDATGNGSTSAPFATIGHAIAVVSAGSTIYVDAGTYAGSTGPDKQLTILGSNATISPNTGSRVAESVLTDPQAFRISTTSAVIIKGFRLTTVAGNPIDNYTTSAKITLEKNLFDQSVGLFFANPDSLVVIDNRFNDLDDNTTEGIQVAGNYNGSTGTYMDVHDNTWITGEASGMNLSNVKGIIYHNNFTNIAYYGVLVANACNLDIYENVFSGITNPGLGSPTWGAGVRFYTPGPGLIANVRNNYFTNDYIGVGVRNVGGDGSLAGTTVNVNNNSITGSTDANIKNQATQTLDATCNWYGTTDQAVITSKISGPVTYSPFLVNGTDNAPGTPGFQPVPGSCSGVLICESPAAQAYISNTQTGNQAHRGELGMEFVVNAPGGILIKQLGAFDDGGDGIVPLPGGPNNGVRVAIFNRSTHTIVPGLDVTINGLADHYTGNHRMKDITPVTLPQGDYVIVAKGYHSGEKNGNSTAGGGPYPIGDNGGGAITFGPETSYGPDDQNGFNYPASAGNFGDSHIFLAGTFDFTTVVPCGGPSSCESPAAQAYTSNTQTGNNAHRGELGMEFIVNNAIKIKQLGAFDDGANGITGLPGGPINGVRVAIFNRATQTIVPGLDVIINGLADAYTGNHRMKNIPSVTLPPGDYVIVAKGYHAGERNGNSFVGGGPYPAGNTGGGAITYGNQTSYGPDDPSGFNYPSTEANLGDPHVFLAGTFDFTVVIPCSGLSTNADLANLVLSQGTLMPGFAPGITSYTASVANSVTSITVTPTAAEAHATITVNGSPATSGSPFGPIALAEGSNIINVVVTAQDGTTMKTYTVNVTRAPNGCESAPAQAYTSNTQTGNQAHRGELGMEFFVNNSNGIIIKQLGAFDDGGNGITGLQPGGGVRVAVFNRSTHTIVPGLDVTISGLGDAYTGNHRMVNITPVTLPPGDYVIVAKGYNSGERNGNSAAGGGPFPVGDNGGGAITFGNETSFGPDDPNGFGYPGSAVDLGDSHVFLAGTFKFAVNTCLTAPVIISQTITTGPVTKQEEVSKLALIVKATALRVYPNPTKGQFNVQLSDASASKLTIQVLNSNGRLVEQKTISLTTKTASLVVPFNLVNLPSGIYLVKVESVDGIRIEKIIIER